MNAWQSIQELGVQLALPGVAFIVLAALKYAGCFSRRVLNRGPVRDVGLRGWDLLIAYALIVVGSLAVGIAMRSVLGAANLQQDSMPLDRMVVVVIASQLGGLLPAAMYFAARCSGVPAGWRLAGIVPRRPGRDLAAAAVGLLVALPIVMGVMTLTAVLAILIGKPPPELGHLLLEKLAASEPSYAWLGLFLSVIVLAPLLEEMIYRGLAQTALQSMLGHQRRWISISIASAAFVVVHLGAVPWHSLPGLLALSFVLGWLYERTGSLWPGVVCHAGFNALNILAVILMYQNQMG